MTENLKLLFIRYGNTYLEWRKSYENYDDSAYYLEQRLNIIANDIVELVKSENG